MCGGGVAPLYPPYGDKGRGGNRGHSRVTLLSNVFALIMMDLRPKMTLARRI